MRTGWVVSQLRELALRLGQSRPWVDGQGRLAIYEASSSSVVMRTGSNWDPVQMQILTWLVWDED